MHVAESGSRAWGFASPDSDYDVRAIYISPSDVYLSIGEHKDTFEYIENQWFDVGGWDIHKALSLLRKSNAVLLEWLQSPTVYQQDDDFVKQLNDIVPQYVQTAPLLHHYRGIAHNALKDLDLQNEIRLKKWFYVLRPLLAARWAVLHGGVPPMVLRDLMSDWQTTHHQEIFDLIELKSNQDEQYRHILSANLRHLTQQLIDEVAQLSPPVISSPAIEPLNQLFRATLKRCEQTVFQAA
ncbi:MAG: nucleotidyltransferase domain-containing protein [Alysiella sp.]|uniref:nucleotidyltransferase domain-containing protein n=1 Tax=Alysiella sp. TaxID=1872483 RepID=UPI0026DC303E|nr:nucleotidyltransferase domain-containing protein [Alysiella sp.]MDO4432977.1 nucleotidyltransferase domain-containing protein [Alysiella sp.]